LGELTVDVAYGGNFYAIVDPQPAFADMADFTALDLIRLSPLVVRPSTRPTVSSTPSTRGSKGSAMFLWTGKPTVEGATARNAVFYGDKAIDRSPCGTGTSARMAQWVAKGMLLLGEAFVHESIIGSTFTGRAEAQTKVGTAMPSFPPFQDGPA
jgi:4-hydroxyproline epimerase